MFKLREYQERCHKETMEYLSSKKGLKPGLIVMPTGCHERGYKVFNSTGELIKVEDIKIGDLLMGNDGTPRKVLNTIQNTGDLYKISLKGLPNNSLFYFILFFRRSH